MSTEKAVEKSVFELIAEVAVTAHLPKVDEELLELRDGEVPVAALDEDEQRLYALYIMSFDRAKQERVAYEGLQDRRANDINSAPNGGEPAVVERYKDRMELALANALKANQRKDSLIQILFGVFSIRYPLPPNAQGSVYEVRKGFKLVVTPPEVDGETLGSKVVQGIVMILKGVSSAQTP